MIVIERVRKERGGGRQEWREGGRKGEEERGETRRVEESRGDKKRGRGEERRGEERRGEERLILCSAVESWWLNSTFSTLSTDLSFHLRTPASASS